MRLIAEAGTDGAMVALWDPQALPEDFDARYRQEPGELLKTLQEQGRLFWDETGGDGAYLLHLYVDEPVPSHLEPYLQNPVEIPQFQVPGGSLWFAGAEYAFHTEDSRLRAHPHMGGRLELPVGVYWARFAQVEYPDDHVEEQIRRRLGDDAYRVRDASGGLIAGAMFVSLAALISLFLSRLSPWSLGLIGLAAVLWIGVTVMTRSRRYREVGERSEQIEHEFPSYIAELRSLETSKT